MSTNSTVSSTVRRLSALALAATFAGAPHAAPRALNDDEMSAVRGADGSILAALQPATPGSQNPLANGLAAAFSGSTGSALLSPAEFAAALEPGGLSPSMLPGYAGQPVAQTKVDAAPITFSFDASAILQTVGLAYSGPSMGTFTMKDFDARGTTIWVWQHH
jgi:hypothetical protein